MKWDKLEKQPCIFGNFSKFNWDKLGKKICIFWNFSRVNWDKLGTQPCILENFNGSHRDKLGKHISIIVKFNNRDDTDDEQSLHEGQQSLHSFWALNIKVVGQKVSRIKARHLAWPKELCPFYSL